MGNPIFTGFFVFLSGSFVIGMAVTILQVVTGLYLDVNPVGKTTPLQRQMIGGTTNSIGMAIGPLVVSYIIFYGIPLHNVQSREFIWPGDLPDSDYLYFYPYNSQNQNAGN